MRSLEERDLHAVDLGRAQQVADRVFGVGLYLDRGNLEDHGSQRCRAVLRHRPDRIGGREETLGGIENWRTRLQLGASGIKRCLLLGLRGLKGIERRLLGIEASESLRGLGALLCQCLALCFPLGLGGEGVDDIGHAVHRGDLGECRADLGTLSRGQRRAVCGGEDHRPGAACGVGELLLQEVGDLLGRSARDGHGVGQRAAPGEVGPTGGNHDEDPGREDPSGMPRRAASNAIEQFCHGFSLGTARAESPRRGKCTPKWMDCIRIGVEDGVTLTINAVPRRGKGTSLRGVTVGHVQARLWR